MSRPKGSKNSITAKQADAVVLDEKFQNLDKLIISQNVFGHDELGLRGIKAAMQINSLKTGMYARIPIYCKDEKCPFADNCILYMNGVAPAGQACPVEIAQLEQKIRAYTTQFGLDPDKMNEQATDWALVEEIITMEVYMSRCKAKMALEQDPVQMMVTGVSEDGDPITTPNVSKYVDAYERFSRKRDRDYELLLATRKSVQKEKQDNKEIDVLSLIEQAQQEPGFYDIEQKPEHLNI